MPRLSFFADTSITMCAQTIFTSLDHLQAWLHNYTPVPVKGKASKSTSQAQGKLKLKQNTELRSLCPGLISIICCIVYMPL